jgi:hypothetical protein
VADGANGVSASPNGSLAVLLDAFAVEEMMALGFDCVLGYVVAEAADGRFHHVGGELEVFRALEDEIRMTRLTLM